MPIPTRLTEHWQQLMTETQEEIERLLNDVETRQPDMDHELLTKIVLYNLRQSQESSVVLCKVLEDYQRGSLNEETILALAQWT